MNFNKQNDYELLYLIREGNEDAKDIMFKKYTPFIKKIAHKYFPSVKNCGVEFDDLVQEGLIALNKTLKTFKDSNNVLFYTFFSMCLERHYITYCRNSNSNKNYCLNNNIGDDSLFFVSENNIDFFNDNLFNKDLFIYYKNYFNFMDSNIFELRINGFTYREISNLLDISLKLVDSRLSKIRRVIRKQEQIYN